MAVKSLTQEEIDAIKAKAQETFAKSKDRLEELEEMYKLIQPLLVTLCEALYGEDVTDVPLEKLIKDAVDYINGNQNGVIH